MAPEPENAAPVKKLRTARTAKKPGRPSVVFTENDPHTADLSTDRKVSPITAKQAERPDSKPADGDSGAETEAA